MRDHRRPELRVENRLPDDTCRSLYRLRDRLPHRNVAAEFEAASRKES